MYKGKEKFLNIDRLKNIRQTDSQEQLAIQIVDRYINKYCEATDWKVYTT